LNGLRFDVHLNIMSTLDHYEFLQISPKAEPDTIARVFRFLAARFHPDNPETGELDKFIALKEAYDVLSDPARRQEYDATRTVADTQPLSAKVDFMDGVQGELNRRVALLALLYLRRRTRPDAPEVTLAEVEQQMGFPRDYLDFTIWYLKSKKYITRADNSDFTLTAIGVDFVEANSSKLPVLHLLLNRGTVTDSHADIQIEESHDAKPEV
jgi:curved DNA-binding protein